MFRLAASSTCVSMHCSHTVRRAWLDQKKMLETLVVVRCKNPQMLIREVTSMRAEWKFFKQKSCFSFNAIYVSECLSLHCIHMVSRECLNREKKLKTLVQVRCKNPQRLIRKDASMRSE